MSLQTRFLKICRKCKCFFFFLRRTRAEPLSHILLHPDSLVKEKPKFMAIKSLIATYLDDPGFVDKVFEDEQEKDVADTKLALLAVGNGLDNALDGLDPQTMLSSPSLVTMIKQWEEDMPLTKEKEIALLIELEVSYFYRPFPVQSPSALFLLGLSLSLCLSLSSSSTPLYL